MRHAVLMSLAVLGLAAGSPLAGEGGDELTFAGSRDEVERLMGYYEAIHLTPEQEAVRVAALEPLPAPCCSDFSAATCCCECNLSRATWGLSKHLISTLGYGPEEVRETVQRFHAAVNPDGFPGDTCPTGACGHPMRADGCGGMSAAHLAY
ncbi:MAG: hypothetical protein ACRD0X_03315 [Thermoanaerobaculia bacterium]